MLCDPVPIAKRTILLAWIWFTADCGLALSSLWEINVLGGISGTTSSSSAIIDAADLGAIAGCLYFLATLICAVTFFRWVYMVNRNAHQWSAAMTIGPGWNIAWFFVPVAGLWMPYTGLRQTRGATIDSDDPDSVPVPNWMRLWWSLWVATSLLGNVTFRLSLHAETNEAVIAADWFYVASLIIDLPLTVLLCRLLTDISTLQSDRLVAPAANDPPADVPSDDAEDTSHR